MKHPIVLVEDYKDLLEAMTLVLDASEKYKIIGSFTNAEEALEQVPQLLPETVLMDINLPKLSGIECVSRLKKECPNTLFVMCTSY